MGEDVAAFVVASQAVEVHDLVRHCRTHLTGYKVPRDIVLVDSLPKSTAGKVIKAGLSGRLSSS